MGARRWIGVVVAMGTLWAFAAVSPLAAADTGAARAHAAAACPGTFQVLHNDSIGRASFPAGPYVMRPSGVSCANASSLFARFLADWDGALPGGWSVVRIGGTWGFQQGRGGAQILPVPQVKPAGQVCQGTFAVTNAATIGNASVARGRYRIKLIGSRPPSCGTAADVLSQAIVLRQTTRPWRFNGQTLTFTIGSSGFQLTNRTAISGGGGGTTGGYACTSFFQVVRSTTISGPAGQSSRSLVTLPVPRGPYRIVILSGGGISCSGATSRFLSFLNSARVSSPWTLQPSTGTFFSNVSRNAGFRVEPKNVG